MVLINVYVYAREIWNAISNSASDEEAKNIMKGAFEEFVTNAKSDDLSEYYCRMLVILVRESIEQDFNETLKVVMKIVEEAYNKPIFRQSLMEYWELLIKLITNNYNNRADVGNRLNVNILSYLGAIVICAKHIRELHHERYDEISQIWPTAQIFLRIDDSVLTNHEVSQGIVTLVVAMSN